MIFQFLKNYKTIFSLVWNTMFTDFWNVLVLNFPEMRKTVFFEPKSWWNDDIYWFLESSCFDLFRDEKYGLVLSQKVDGKMIFTWSFWAFHDIPGLRKYDFLCSENFYERLLFSLCITNYHVKHMKYYHII